MNRSHILISSLAKTTASSAATANARKVTSSAGLVGLLSTAIMLSYIDRGLLAISGPLIKPDLGLSATEFGLAVSAFFWIYAPAQLACGWLADHFSAPRLFAVGVALWAVATGLMGAAAGLLSLIAVRLLLGFGQSFCFPGAAKMIVTYCQTRNRGACNGTISTGLALGQMVGSSVGGLFMVVFGWRGMCPFFGLFTLAWLFPWSRIRLVEVGEPVEHEPAVPFGAILRQRALLGTCAGHFGNNYGMYFIITWLPLYLVAERELSVALMAMLTAALFAMQGCAALFGGWLSDRFAANGRHEGSVRKAFEVGANLVKATAIIGIAVADSLIAMILWLSLTAMMIGVTGSQNFAIPQIFAGKRASGRWVGIQNFSANTAGIFGPIITGILLDRTDSYIIPFIVAGTMTFFSAFAWAFIVPRVEPIAWTERPIRRFNGD